MRENSTICCKVVLAVVFSNSRLRAMLMFGIVSGVLGGLSTEAFAAPTFFPLWTNSEDVIVDDAGTNTGNGLSCPLLDTSAAALDIFANRTDALPLGNPGRSNAIPAFSRVDWDRANADVRPPHANRKPDFNFWAGVDNWQDPGNGGNESIPLPEQPTVSVVPAPGSILLGSLGTCLVGWLRRRKSL